MSYIRYGIYYTPPAGAFARTGAEWLGWDIATGRPAGTPDDAVTLKPRKYGFHATLKPPFFLAPGHSPGMLEAAVAALAAELAPVTLDGLVLSRLGGFLAFTPEGDTRALAEMAAAVVRDLDGFRAPASEAELARRRRARLSPPEEANLMRWGYPYVMEAFRFHMTLTGPLQDAQIEAARSAAEARFAGLVPRPFVLDGLTLVGETGAGMFQTVGRYTLGR